MSGYWYPPGTLPEDQDYDLNQSYTSQSIQSTAADPLYAAYPTTTDAFHAHHQQQQQSGLYGSLAQQDQSTLSYQSYQYALAQQVPGQAPQQFPSQATQQASQGFPQHLSQQRQWIPPSVPSNHTYEDQNVASFPQYTEHVGYIPESVISGPSRSTGHLSPGEIGPARISRATSFASNASSAASYSEASRSASPNIGEMLKWGTRNNDGSWSCVYPGCTSQSRFHRGCDLRKHYKRHTKTLFCRWEGCPQATEGGFSSKKDRARHEAKHNPNIVCEWDGCDRLFSRQDNMKDHVRRVHKRRIT